MKPAFKTKLFFRNYINRLQHITGGLLIHPLYFCFTNEAQGQTPTQSLELVLCSFIFSNYFTRQQKQILSLPPCCTAMYEAVLWYLLWIHIHLPNFVLLLQPSRRTGWNIAPSLCQENTVIRDWPLPLQILQTLAQLCGTLETQSEAPAWPLPRYAQFPWRADINSVYVETH